MPFNRSRFAPPRRRDDLLEQAPETDIHFAREATKQPEEEDDYERRPCLVLRFSNPPWNTESLVRRISEATVVKRVR
jgi:hypothetical protein